MDEYTPQYAGKLLKSESILLKPFYAMKLKYIFRKIDLSHKNENVHKVASECKNSLLKNYPYYFYIAYSDYYPDIYNSIQASIKDGCGDITILNYSFSKIKLSNELISELNKHKITLKITPPIYTSLNFSEAMLRNIQASTQKQEGILLIGRADAVSARIKASLVAYGYPTQNIIITSKIYASEAMEYFLNNNFKKVFYMNLFNDNYDYKVETALQSLSDNYASAIQLSGLRSWGYNKFLVRASIEILRNKQ